MCAVLCCAVQVMLVLLEVHRWITMSLPSTQQDATCTAARARTTTAYTRGVLHAVLRSVLCCAVTCCAVLCCLPCILQADSEQAAERSAPT